jgi:hypothetical protein
MATSLDLAVARILAVAFFLLNLSALLSSSHLTGVLTVEALPRPRSDNGALTFSNSALSIFRNPFLNQNVELTGNDGNHHDLVQAIMGSPISSSSSSSPTSPTSNMIRKKMKQRMIVNAEASIPRGDSRGPMLRINHSLFTQETSVNTRNKKRQVSPLPNEYGTGGTYNTGMPLGRRRQSKSS